MFRLGNWRTIADCSLGRDNNFNLIRLIAAIAVLVSHAHPISLGRGTKEPLEGLIGLPLGGVAVLIFFAVSGFLIARSWDTGGSSVRFWRARALRILPGLATVLCLTILIGGLATTASAVEYWPSAASYFFRNLTLAFLQFDLPGILRHNPFGPAINGSLWTLIHEVLWYACVMVLGMAGAITSRRRFVAGLVFFALAYVLVRGLEPHPRLVHFVSLGLPFMAGIGFYVFRNLVPLGFSISLIGAIPVAASLGTAIFEPIFALWLSYTVFTLAFLPGGIVRRWNRLGDYSYGTYIYAFPIQQIVAAVGIVSPVLNIALALPMTLALAVLSWRWIEKPALSLTRRPEARAVQLSRS